MERRIGKWGFCFNKENRQKVGFITIRFLPSIEYFEDTDMFYEEKFQLTFAWLVWTFTATRYE